MTLLKRLYSYIIFLNRLYKVLSFTEEGELRISSQRSEILFTKEGDIVLKSERAMISEYKVAFFNTEKEVVKKGLKRLEEGTLHLLYEQESLEAAKQKCSLHNTTLGK